MAPIKKKVLTQRRRQMLSSLKGNILEVGAGTGINFSYYPQGAHVLGIEPNPYMLEKAGKRIPDTADIVLKQGGIGDSTMEEAIAKESLDFIVCTLVLCTIPDIDLALNSFYRWLKPGGKLLVIEHIKSKNKFWGKVQELVNPAWKKFADGCNITRNTDALIKSAGFVPLKEEYFNVGYQGYNAVFGKR